MIALSMLIIVFFLLTVSADTVGEPCTAADAGISWWYDTKQTTVTSGWLNTATDSQPTADTGSAGGGSQRRPCQEKTYHTATGTTATRTQVSTQE